MSITKKFLKEMLAKMALFTKGYHLSRVFCLFVKQARQKKQQKEKFSCLLVI
jgi:hypothetical protein